MFFMMGRTEERILTFTNRSFVIFVESMEDFRFL